MSGAATMHGPGTKIRGLLGIVEARIALLDAGDDQPEERARLEARRAELCAELVEAVGPIEAEDLMVGEQEERPVDPWSERRDLQ